MYLIGLVDAFLLTHCPMVRIRYAAPPVGKLRWQAPQAPLVNRSSIQSATKQPPLCPQSGGAKLPEVYGFNSALGNEDCLFLNVYAPPGAKDLPVLLWIRKSMQKYSIQPKEPVLNTHRRWWIWAFWGRI
jgi:hypothetical protein